MLTRILTSVVAFLLFLPFLIYSDTLAFPIAMSLCAVISTYELVRCVGLHKNQWVTIPLVLTAAAVPVLLRLLGIGAALPLACALLMVLILYMLAVTILSHGKVDINQSSTALLMSVYVILGFSAMVYIRDFHAGGVYFYLLCFIGAWVTDTFAYFSGRLFGRHKLIPDVSPKKTVEGAIGGILFCITAFVGFAAIYNYFLLPEGGSTIPLWLMAVIGLVTSVVSMIGDLSMSVIKRHYGVKDYGKILPGHGGFLDRFDSVLAVAVILAVAFGLAARGNLL